jgi:mono/diheme cytochrome c family protein
MKRNRWIFFMAGGVLLVTVLMSQTKKPVAPAPGGGIQASMDRGKQIYLKQCLACHQADANGVPNMNPPLTQTKQILGDKAALVRIVLFGLTGEVEVSGDTYHNVMPPHPEMTDQEIADVLTYVRNSFGNKAKPVTVADVKVVRAKGKPVK